MCVCVCERPRRGIPLHRMSARVLAGSCNTRLMRPIAWGRMISMTTLWGRVKIIAETTNNL